MKVLSISLVLLVLRRPDERYLYRDLIKSCRRVAATGVASNTLHEPEDSKGRWFYVPTRISDDSGRLWAYTSATNTVWAKCRDYFYFILFLFFYFTEKRWVDATSLAVSRAQDLEEARAAVEEAVQPRRMCPAPCFLLLRIYPLSQPFYLAALFSLLYLMLAVFFLCKNENPFAEREPAVTSSRIYSYPWKK